MNVFNVLISVGVISILGAFIYIGRKLQILDDLKKTTSIIKANVKVIGDHLTKSDKGFNCNELQSYSPLRLTKEGEKIIKNIGFEEIFKAHKNDFYNFIDGESPKLKYDVELASIQSIEALSEKDYMKFLKIFFYNNPDRNLQNFSPTLGVYIRDKYLEAHKEIVE